jgi:hypothetical protein
LGIFAALGDTRRASSLISTVTALTPINRFQGELVAVIIALRERELEVASKHLQTLAATVREYAIPLGEVSCLIGFAALAAATGDHRRASRHLATVRCAAPFPFRTPVEVLVYRQTARSVRDALDHETARRCRAVGAATPVSQAIDEELARLETSAPEEDPARG